MSSSDIIMLMIGACIILIALMLFERPIRALARVALSGAAGAVGMLAANTFLAPLGIFVGINPLTVLIVAFLGLPGFVVMYVVSALL